MEAEISGADWSGAEALLREEARAVYALQLKDIVREIWFTEDHEAVLLLECADKAEAERLLAELPLVKGGLIRFTLKELHPYDGYSRLMG
jgi:muconolactone delta-isomerase